MAGGVRSVVGLYRLRNESRVDRIEEPAHFADSGAPWNGNALRLKNAGNPIELENEPRR